MTDSYHYLPAQPTVCFDDVKARTIALAKISRCAAVDALAVFSVARARELMPWEWASYVEYVDGLLAIAASSTVGPFPSGATLKTSGDKIVGRVEAELSEWDNVKPGAIINIRKPVQYITGGASAAVDPLSAVIARLAASIDADLLKLLSPAPEPKRAPLPHFNQRTEFDAFPDYVVFHEFEPVAPLYDSPTTDSAYPAIAGLLRG